MSDVIGVAIGVLVGGAITYLVSRLFYGRAGEDLRQESAEVRRKIDIVLLSLEEAGIVDLNRDDETGEIMGIVIHARGRAEGIFSATGTATVEPPLEDDDDE